MEYLPRASSTPYVVRLAAESRVERRIDEDMTEAEKREILGYIAATGKYAIGCEPTGAAGFTADCIADALEGSGSPDCGVAHYDFETMKSWDPVRDIFHGFFWEGFAAVLCARQLQPAPHRRVRERMGHRMDLRRDGTRRRHTRQVGPQHPPSHERRRRRQHGTGW